MLSLYFLALNLAPCEDNESVSENVPLLVTAVDSNDGHTHGEVDLCSPFCSCSCCQVHAIAEQHFYSGLRKEIFSYERLESDEGFVQEVSFRLFHPPRFVD